MLKYNLEYLIGKFNKLWLTAVVLIIFIIPARAQLVVDNSIPDFDLVQSLVGDGVIVSGISINCPNIAYGGFEGSSTNVGINSGLLMTSGSIDNAVGPNTSGSSSMSNSGPGDPDLDAIVAGSTNDACIVEFDVEVIADTLKFNYVFGSEEYLEWTFSSFNDVFAFFISGPGIVGAPNIALVPGVGVPVSIDNVNNVNNPSYYVDNGSGGVGPSAADPFYIQYDGFTVVMEARAVVIPCETYHLKLAIADRGDFSLDSGVFIEAGSLTSTGITLESSTSAGLGFDKAVEGCVDGIVSFILDNPAVDTSVIYYTIGGTATNGVDFDFLPDSVVFYPGDTMQFYDIIPFNDGVDEPIESVVVYLISECTGIPYDSAVILIRDSLTLNLNADPTAICFNDTVTLSASGVGNLGYSWTPAEFLSDPLNDSTLAYPPVSTYFSVTSIVGTCTLVDSILVGVSAPPPADAGEDEAICIGDGVTLGASGGVDYSWFPPNGLDNVSIPNPIASPGVTTEYVVLVTDDFGCFTYDTMTVVVNPLPIPNAWPDSLVCPGDIIQLNASGGVSYLWSPGEDMDDPALQNPNVTVSITQVYTVEATDLNGCVNTATLTLTADPFPIVEAGDNEIIEVGASVTLNGSADNSYIWSPDDYMSDPTVLNPTVSPLESTYYYLTSTSPGSCVTVDSVFVIVIEPQPVVIPNAFTPNGDGNQDLFRPILLSPLQVDEFRVYNRWGELLYSSPDVTGGWDGTYQGKAQEIGTYIYIFAATDDAGEPITRQGTVTLLR